MSSVSVLLDFAASPYSVHVGFLFLLIPLLSNPIKEQTSNTLENSQSSANIDYIAPLKNYEITCAWGCYAGHEGIDMRDPNNKDADVLAVAEGVPLANTVALIEVGDSKNPTN